MKNIRPLKKFGQNYLIDKNIIHKIVDLISPENYDRIIEIGPGKGALTREIYKINKNIICFEIDTRVIEDLATELNLIKIINKDFLKVDLSQYIIENTIIVGNIPYNITSPILFKLIDSNNTITDVVLMVQHEVASRLIAKPRTKEYGILSVILNYFAEVEYAFKVSPTCFYPKPKVDSAIIKITFKKNFDSDFNSKLFIKVVKACFGNRRKTLKNSLANSEFSDVDFSSFDFDFTRRAEQLSIDDFIILMKYIENQSKKNS